MAAHEPVALAFRLRSLSELYCWPVQHSTPGPENMFDLLPPTLVYSHIKVVKQLAGQSADVAFVDLASKDAWAEMRRAGLCRMGSQRLWQTPAFVRARAAPLAAPL